MTVSKKHICLVLSAVFAFEILFSPALVQEALAQNRSVIHGLDAADFWKTRAAGRQALAPLDRERKKWGKPSSPATPFPVLNSLLKEVSPFVRLSAVRPARPGAPLVILLQDVHSHLEAQRNIAQTLRRAERVVPGLWTACEAAAGDFNFARYAAFPDAAIVGRSADYLLRTNRISGLSYFGLTSPRASVTGVDDPELYARNVEAFTAVASKREAAAAAVQSRIDALAGRRASLSPALAGIDESLRQFHAGGRDIGAHVAALSTAVPLADYPALLNLSETIELEKRIDTTRAKAERDHLFQAMARARAETLNGVLSLSLAQQSGDVNASDFARELTSLIHKAGLRLESYPQFADYLRYTAMADGIRHERIFGEIKKMAADAVEKAAVTADEKAFMAESTYLQLAKKLAAFELTPDEWTDYRALRDAGAGFERLALAGFEKFYEVAERRNDAMARGTIEGLARRPTAVLLVGGFHSDGLVSLFEKKGISYAVLTPRLSDAGLEGGSDYLNVFLRERTPLAKLFAGEKLTVAAAAQLLGAPEMSDFGAEEARALLGVIYGAAAAQDGRAELAEKNAVEALGGPRLESVDAKSRTATLADENGEIETGVGLDAPDHQTVEGVLDEPITYVFRPRTWSRLASAAAAVGAVVFLTGAAGGQVWPTLIAFSAGVLFVGVIVGLIRLYRHLREVAEGGERLPITSWWHWLYALVPVRLYIVGTGRTGVPNLLRALHNPAYQVVAMNGLETEDGSTKLEALARLIEHDEVFGDYGNYRVKVRTAGRAWIDDKGLHLTRSGRPDGKTFEEPRGVPTGLRERWAFQADRLYADRTIRHLDRAYPEWRKAWSDEQHPDGQARLEWLDIEVNGSVRRVLFFNARNEKLQYFPARALGMVGMSETSGAILERKKLVPAFSAGGVQVAALGSPPKDKGEGIPLSVMGVNHEKLRELIEVAVSNCSCTTNGGVPLLFAIAIVSAWLGGQPLEIERGHMATTHGPTVSDQDSIDVPKAGKKSEGRSPASVTQTIMTTTGFLDVAKPVLESAGIKVGAISGISFRVPANPSKVALSFDVKGRLSEAQVMKIFIIAAGITDDRTIEALIYNANKAPQRRGREINVADVRLNDAERAAAENSPMKGIIAVVSEPESYSSEYAQAEASTVLNLAHVAAVFDEQSGETRVDLHSWYANEWGYAVRTLDTLRALAIRFWITQGLWAFLGYVFFGWLPVPRSPLSAFAPAKKKEEDAKPASVFSVEGRPDPATLARVQPAQGDPYPEPVVALGLDASSKVQYNKALIYLWNYLAGDRSIRLSALIGVPGGQAELEAFVKMLRHPSGYPPLKGQFDLIPAGWTAEGFENPRRYPVLRHTLNGVAVEIALISHPTADQIDGLAGELGAGTVLELGRPKDASRWTKRGFYRVVTSGSSAPHELAAPNAAAPVARPLASSLSGRALAAYHMASALAGLPDNRVSFLSVHGFVFGRGEKPVLARLRGRRGEGNIQVENFGDETALENALAAGGVNVQVRGTNDVVNNQSGSIIEISATLAKESTPDQVKAALKKYVAAMREAGYRVLLSSGKQQIFSSDSFAGIPAIVINTDSIEVNGGRQVVISAWFDDRLADLNAMNEVVLSQRGSPFAPITAAIAAAVGPVAGEAMELRLDFSPDEIKIERPVSFSSGRYFGGIRYEKVASAPARLAIPFLRMGVSEITLNLAAGDSVEATIASLLGNWRGESRVSVKTDFSDAMGLIRTIGSPADMAALLDRIQESAHSIDAIPGFLETEHLVEKLMASISDGQLAEFARHLSRIALGTTTGEVHGVKAAALGLAAVQRVILQRIAARSGATDFLIDVNRDVFRAQVFLISIAGPVYVDPVMGAVLNNLPFSEGLELTLESGVWGGPDAPEWKTMRDLFGVWAEGSHIYAGAAVNAALSFVKALGVRAWRSQIERLFSQVSARLGHMNTTIWAYDEAAGPALAAAWKAVDGSDNSTLRRIFYGIAVEFAKDPKSLGALLEFAGEDAELKSRVLSLIAVVYTMTRWQFVDKEMPWPFVIFALRQAGPYSMIKFKHFLAGSLLARAPSMLGLPVDAEIKDKVVVSAIDSKRLYDDVFDFDQAIQRQVWFFGIDERALEMVAARLEWWRTGNPARAVAAAEAYAGPQTQTWRETVQAGEPRVYVARLFEMLGAKSAPGLSVDQLLTGASNSELEMNRIALLAEFPGDTEKVEKLFSVEIPLYRSIATAVLGDDADVNVLRGLSNSDLRGINDKQLMADIYDPDRLVHRFVHHGIGEPALELVRERFEYWRTGDLSVAVKALERFAPEITVSWRANPSHNKPPEWFAIVATASEVLGRMLGHGPAPDAFVEATEHQLSGAQAEVAARFPDHKKLVNQLFEREIRLFRLLKRRYDPIHQSAAIKRIKNGHWPIDTKELTDVIERGAPVEAQLEILAKTRLALERQFMGSSRGKYDPDDPDLKPSYGQQHGIQGIYGFTVRDSYYRAFELDRLLRRLEERILEESREALKSQSFPERYVPYAARLLSRAIDLVHAVGWGSRPLADLQALLSAPGTDVHRLILLCRRIQDLFQSQEWWTNNQWGRIIDAVAADIRFEELSPALASAMKITDSSSLDEHRLRFRSHVLGELLRANIPLFFLKDIAAVIRQTLAAVPDKERQLVPFELPHPVFFPASTFSPQSQGSLLSDYSQKGANLKMIGEAGDFPIPPGVIYPIEMPAARIRERVWKDIDQIRKALEKMGLADVLGSGMGRWARSPILFAVRSGAIFDAPGQQDTVTNWGLSEENIDGLIERIGERAAWDALRRFYEEYARAVLGIDRAEFRRLMDDFKERIGKDRKNQFSGAEARELAKIYRARIEELRGPEAIPATLEEQLFRIVTAIHESWDMNPMRSFRQSEGMLHERGSAIILQVMVNGNSSLTESEVSGAGALFSGAWPWDLAYGSFALQAEGSDIADGVITPDNLSVIARKAPKLLERINEIVRCLQEWYGTKIEIEYTIQNGVFWILQVRRVPEEGVLPNFDPDAVARHRPIADGWGLVGNAAKGPMITIHHLRSAVKAVDEWLSAQPANGEEVRRQLSLGNGNMTGQLQELLSQIISETKDPVRLRDLSILLFAVETVAGLTEAEPSHVGQIGLIVGSDEAVPEDLPYVRFLNELTGNRIVVGMVSNRGGPGTHAQENGINLQLAAMMAGTSSGEIREEIDFDSVDGTTILFQTGGGASLRVHEGKDVVSLQQHGEVMAVYAADLPFERPDSRLTDTSAFSSVSSYLTGGLLTAMGLLALATVGLDIFLQAGWFDFSLFHWIALAISTLLAMIQGLIMIDTGRALAALEDGTPGIRPVVLSAAMRQRAGAIMPGFVMSGELNSLAGHRDGVIYGHPNLAYFHLWFQALVWVHEAAHQLVHNVLPRWAQGRFSEGVAILTPTVAFFSFFAWISPLGAALWLSVAIAALAWFLPLDGHQAPTAPKEPIGGDRQAQPMDQAASPVRVNSTAVGAAPADEGLQQSIARGLAAAASRNRLSVDEARAALRRVAAGELNLADLADWRDVSPAILAAAVSAPASARTNDSWLGALEQGAYAQGVRGHLHWISNAAADGTGTPEAYARRLDAAAQLIGLGNAALNASDAEVQALALFGLSEELGAGAGGVNHYRDLIAASAASAARSRVTWSRPEKLNPARDVAHFSLNDLTAAANAARGDEKAEATLKARLVAIAQLAQAGHEAGRAGVILTAPRGASEARVIATLAGLMAASGVTADLPALRSAVVVDRAARANPYAAARAYASRLSGRRLHAVPLRIGDATPHWDLSDLAAFSRLGPEEVASIVIEIVNLATGSSTRVEGRMSGALNAALRSLQSA